MSCPESIYAARAGVQDYHNAGSDLIDPFTSDVVNGRCSIDEASVTIMREIAYYAANVPDAHCADCALAWATTHAKAAVAGLRHEIAAALARKAEEEGAI